MSALDHSVLQRLYSEHNGWLKGWLRVRLGNTADACDLAQDTFLRVMTARHDTPIREPRGYLSAIARSLLIDNVLLAALAGVFAFSSLWTIKELFEQRERVAKGWFPANPKRKGKKS